MWLKKAQGTDNNTITRSATTLSKHFCYFEYLNLHSYTLAPLCVQTDFKVQCRDPSQNTVMDKEGESVPFLCFGRNLQANISKTLGFILNMAECFFFICYIWVSSPPPFTTKCIVTPPPLFTKSWIDLPYWTQLPCNIFSRHFRVIKGNLIEVALNQDKTRKLEVLYHSRCVKIKTPSLFKGLERLTKTYM